MKALNDRLHRHASVRQNLTLLSELPLPEQDFQASFHAFVRVVSDGHRLQRSARTTPFAYGRMLTEVAARSFVPRTSGSPRGTGLWQNLHAVIPAALAGDRLGKAFERTLRFVSREFPSIFFGNFSGWRYVGNILTHAGIPVKAAAPLIDALHLFLPKAEDWARRINGPIIRNVLSGQTGLNKYTVAVLSETVEGERLVQQFLRLCHFIQNGGIPRTAVFSKPFIAEVQAVLRGDRSPPAAVSPTLREPLFAYDMEDLFIGWIVPAGDPSDVAYVVDLVDGSDAHAQEPVSLSKERIGFPVRPRPTRLRRLDHPSSPSDTWSFKPQDLMLFHGRNGIAAGRPDRLPAEIVAGEYVLIAKPLSNVDIEERFHPKDKVVVTEDGVLLPAGWSRTYEAFRVRLQPTDQLQVQLDRQRWHPLKVKRDSTHDHGYVILTGVCSTSLSAYHAAVFERQIPVFAGQTFPELHLWGERFGYNVPEIRIYRWNDNGEWSELADIVPRVRHFPNGAVVVFDRQASASPPIATSILRLSFIDLSYQPVPLDEQYFLWLPNAYVLEPVGLLPSAEGVRLALQLPGRWTATALLGTVKKRELAYATRIIHRLPKGSRKARLRLRPRQPPSPGFTLEWSAMGYLAGALIVDAATEAEIPMSPMPIESEDLAQLEDAHRLELAWWPGLTTRFVNVLNKDERFLGHVVFDRRGRASLPLLPLKPLLRDEMRERGCALLALQANGHTWPLLRVGSPISRQRASGQEETNVLPGLLWRAERFLSQPARFRHATEMADLHKHLASRSGGSAAARFMLDRIVAQTPFTVGGNTSWKDM